VFFNPFARRVRIDKETADALAQTWWIALLAGAVSIVFGVLVLAIDWSVSSLAVFVGALFILQGISWAAARPLDGGSRTWSLVLGAIGAAAGIVMIIWPEIGLLTLAVFIGAWLVCSGVIRIVGALANRDLPHWWLVLVAGLIEVPIGIWALRRPGMTLAILITLVGAWSIVTGIWQCVIAFELRNLPRRIGGREALDPVEAS
jgi:uncharacterized membrane protein HdeD (DUF308 family)